MEWRESKGPVTIQADILLEAGWEAAEAQEAKGV